MGFFIPAGPEHANETERDEKDVLRSEVLEGFSEEMIELIHALQKERDSFGEMGIDLEEKPFYDILKSLAQKYDFEYPEDKLIKLAKEVKTVVDDKARYTDWSQRDDIKAELKVDLIMLLGENGYPPVDRDEVYKEKAIARSCRVRAIAEQKACANDCG